MKARVSVLCQHILSPFYCQPQKLNSATHWKQNELRLVVQHNDRVDKKQKWKTGEKSMANFCVSRTNQIICSVTTAEEKKKHLILT